MKAAYQNLRANARRRGIPFLLTFEEFEEFAIRTELLVNKGKKKDSYSVDRIRNSEGYHRDNIQMLTLGENGRKGYLEYDWQSKIAVVRKSIPPVSGTPF